jgi:hypothetical protein
MSVRIPSDQRYVPQINKEHRWLPVLAPQLPVPIPRPIARGRPGCGFPAPWSIYGWVDGDPVAIVGVTDYDRLADDLARFLAALQAIDTEDGPPAGAHSFNRGGPVSVWDEQTRTAIGQLAGEIDVDGALGVWRGLEVGRCGRHYRHSRATDRRPRPHGRPIRLEIRRSRRRRPSDHRRSSAPARRQSQLTTPTNPSGGRGVAR